MKGRQPMGNGGMDCAGWLLVVAGVLTAGAGCAGSDADRGPSDSPREDAACDVAAEVGEEAAGDVAAEVGAGDGCGECVDVVPCSPSSCPGCCDDQGACQLGTLVYACGKDGDACVNCSLDGRYCGQDTRACESTPICGAWNCDGCCDQAGKCRDGGEETACGTYGQPCEDCSKNGTMCHETAHSCYDGAACDSNNCSGCCDPETFECHKGLEAAACGTLGQVCIPCEGPALSCWPSSSGGGLCLVVETNCGPQTCWGCCECKPPDPCTCLEGTDDWACGHSGQVCQECNEPGMACVDISMHWQCSLI